LLEAAEEEEALAEIRMDMDKLLVLLALRPAHQVVTKEGLMAAAAVAAAAATNMAAPEVQLLMMITAHILVQMDNH
jgi:hypothetical protein